MPTAFRPLSAHPRHIRLAERILEAAVAEDWPAGARVIEQELSRRLGVSRTPVRAALSLLVQHGVVRIRPNRGHILARSGAELAGFRLPFSASAERILHDTLISDRLAGRIGPEFAQSALARRYRTGLAVVQRALARLEEEGLVSRTGWRWSFVPSLDTEQSRRTSYELRLMLEPPSLLVPGFRAERAVLEQLVEEHTSLAARPEMAQEDPARVFALDARFHETLANWSGNLFVLSMVRQQNTLRRLLGLGSYADRARVAVWCREHMAILSAIAADDMAMAARLMHRHLMHAAAAAEHSLALAGATARPVRTRRRPV
ncbi:MAG TPA: FCD domain-containing protein [Acetobacteraceae bacterium]|jgi:DNA-binding GntR family transcriptional regulator|nr:FCD domain-containing protein [Acetobacteraceae bacterium]